MSKTRTLRQEVNPFLALCALTLRGQNTLRDLVIHMSSRSTSPEDGRRSRARRALSRAMANVTSWPAFSSCLSAPRLGRSLNRFSAPSRRRPSERVCRRPSAASVRASAAQADGLLARIVCVGDIHGQWDASDEAALTALSPDLALFVGDYGNENLRVVGRISALAESVPYEVATVFGNHDAFYTASERGRANAPYDATKTCRVTEQKRLLKETDVSYRARELDAVDATLVGGRPWSWGGPHWKHGGFYRAFEGVNGVDHSAAKLISAVEDDARDAIVFLCHSGPTGLGDKMTDPCGRDWGGKPGGDHGDADLRSAIDAARGKGKRVPLVVFGHMHRTLCRNRGTRRMLVTETDGEGETVMLNAAVVPRHRPHARGEGRLHNFQVVELADGGVRRVEDVWVTEGGEVAEGNVLYGGGKEVDRRRVDQSVAA